MRSCRVSKWCEIAHLFFITLGEFASASRDLDYAKAWWLLGCPATNNVAIRDGLSEGFLQPLWFHVCNEFLNHFGEERPADDKLRTEEVCTIAGPRVEMLLRLRVDESIYYIQTFLLVEFIVSFIPCM